MAGMRSGVGRTAGTRGGVGRISAMALGLAVLAALVLADAARAGTYEVAQCGWRVGVELDPVPGTYGPGFVANQAWCATGVQPQVLRLEALAAADGQEGLARARWVAPPGTSFIAASTRWGGGLQPGFVRLLGYDAGPEFRTLASGTGIGTFPPASVQIPGGGGAVEVRLTCLGLCVRSSATWLWLTELTFTVLDPTPPATRIGGPLLAPGWKRGTGQLEIDATDPGAGVAREEASADGTSLAVSLQPCATATIEGELRGTQLRPCPATAPRVLDIDTTKLADGAHALRGCAVDFGGEVGCADAQIEVDNSPPAIAFTATRAGQVAVTLSDPYSGPAAGTISVRRDGTPGTTELPTRFEAGAAGTARLVADLPELADGTYVFRATANDALGNAGSSELRVNGSAAQVRERVAAGGKGGSPRPRGVRDHGGDADRGTRATHIRAHLVAGGPDGRARPDAGSAGSVLTVPFGAAVEVRGRLTRDDGAGLVGEPVVVVASAARGARPRRALRRVLTGPGGRFALRLPGRTSRRVLVSFRGGDGPAASRSRALALRVAAAVSLTAEPHQLATGETILLRGRVRPGPARIPRRGKVVAIQYLERAGGDWRPALVVRTDGRGRFHVRYRFRYITGTARIRLRATALPEAGWPYTAGSSPPLTVEVHG